MRKTFATLSDFESAIFHFEDCIDVLDVAYKDFIVVTNVNGEAISSLNDVVRVQGMNTFNSDGIFGILHYFTELEVPEEIKIEIEHVFNAIFYSA